MYSEPNTNSTFVIRVPNDKLVFSANRPGEGVDWYEVKYGSTTGYIQAKYIRGTAEFEEEQTHAQESIDIYVTGVYYTGSDVGNAVGFANVVIYYTFSNTVHDQFVLSGSASACNGSANYNSNANMIREITSDDERLSGKNLTIRFSDGTQVTKTGTFSD